MFSFNPVVFIWLHLLSEEKILTATFLNFTSKTEQLVNDAKGGVHCFFTKLSRQMKVRCMSTTTSCSSHLEVLIDFQVIQMPLFFCIKISDVRFFYESFFKSDLFIESVEPVR